MERIAARFRALRERDERALIPFLTAGDPDLATTEALVLALAEAGADALELGVPFSDPIAEGPTIQRASERALAGGSSLRRILDLVKTLRPQVDIPLILMGYANPVYAFGETDFPEAARAAGVDGLIVADLPPEEGEALFDGLERHGVAPILLAAPTTTEARLARLAARTRGFLYYVSLTGVTGARDELPPELEAGVARVRRVSDVPVCVGFGVKTPEQVRAIARFADGVVVGSAFVDRIAAAPSRDAAVDAAVAFAKELRGRSWP